MYAVVFSWQAMLQQVVAGWPAARSVSPCSIAYTALTVVQQQQETRLTSSFSNMRTLYRVACGDRPILSLRLLCSMHQIQTQGSAPCSIWKGPYVVLRAFIFFADKLIQRWAAFAVSALLCCATAVWVQGDGRLQTYYHKAPEATAHCFQPNGV